MLPSLVVDHQGKLPVNPPPCLWHRLAQRGLDPLITHQVYQLNNLVPCQWVVPEDQGPWVPPQVEWEALLLAWVARLVVWEVRPLVWVARLVV